MTPKEKARELVEKFYPLFTNSAIDTLAKQCALIVVDEILDTDYPHSDFQDLELHVSYWEEVKQEIEKL